jgi:pimeloyl-ACP methyl ester carboxylesterase
LKYARDFTGHNDVQAMAALVRGMRYLVASEAQLNAVRVPTLAIIGTADPLLADVNALEKAWPALKVVRIEGATHSNMIPPGRGAAARPEFLTTIRDFINTNKQ